MKNQEKLTENIPAVPTYEEHCETAIKFFSCLNFPLEDFTKTNQKTALAHPRAEEITTDQA